MLYGICNLAVVPMREEPADQAEMVSQLVFGEAFYIEDQTKKWTKVINAFDEYRGWIDPKQFHPIERDQFEKSTKTSPVYCAEKLGQIKIDDRSFFIPFGSKLSLDDENFLEWSSKKLQFHGRTCTSNLVNSSKIIADAANFLDTPYLWGGKSIFGIDCSGFTQAVFRMNAIKLPRDSKDQVRQGQEITFEEVKEGDLAFFHNINGKINHVGIVMNDGKIIHASGKVRIDTLLKEGIYNNEREKISHHSYSFKRILENN